MLYDEGTMGMKVKAPLKSTFSFFFCCCFCWMDVEALRRFNALQGNYCLNNVAAEKDRWKET